MPVVVSTRRLSKRSVRGPEVRRRAERMLRALRMPDAELSVLLCDDETIRELNREYRGKDRPTDVLSFSMREGEGGELHPDLLGDVVISLPIARRQAKERGRTIHSEVTFLLAHGLLHLLGYDHRDADEERRMKARTDALISASRSGRGSEPGS